MGVVVGGAAVVPTAGAATAAYKLSDNDKTLHAILAGAGAAYGGLLVVVCGSAMVNRTHMAINLRRLNWQVPRNVPPELEPLKMDARAAIDAIRPGYAGLADLGQWEYANAKVDLLNEMMRAQ